MKMKMPASPSTAKWRHYDELSEVETITVGEAVVLLVEHWPQDGESGRRELYKMVRSRIMRDAKAGRLTLSGEGEKARVSPHAFFRWAVGWHDKRKGPVNNDAMSAAAHRFGAPNSGQISGEMGALRGRAVVVTRPRDCEEAHALSLEFQRKYVDAMGEIERLGAENEALKKDAAKYRDLMASWTRSGKASGGKRYD